MHFINFGDYEENVEVRKILKISDSFPCKLHIYFLNLNKINYKGFLHRPFGFEHCTWKKNTMKYEF